MAKKPLKFYQTLNQAPRSVKHGQHRRAGKTAHRDSSFGADYSAGGADQSGTVWVTWNPGWSTSYSPIDFPEPEPAAPIPYAGVRTGELIAYRAWFVINHHELRSLAHHYIWEPGATVSGDIMKPIDNPYNFMRRHPLMGGVYAHFSKVHTMDDLAEEWAAKYPVQIERDTDPFSRVYSTMLYGNETVTIDACLGIAIGAVKLWGEVVEHERGYRAERAKLVSIDQVCGVVDIDRLRAKYLSPE